MKETARKFLESAGSKEFKDACSRVQAHRAGTKGLQVLEPSVRQVRKWRRKTGLAYKMGRAT